MPEQGGPETGHSNQGEVRACLCAWRNVENKIKFFIRYSLSDSFWVWLNSNSTAVYKVRLLSCNAISSLLAITAPLFLGLTLVAWLWTTLFRPSQSSHVASTVFYIQLMRWRAIGKFNSVLYILYLNLLCFFVRINYFLLGKSLHLYD